MLWLLLSCSRPAPNGSTSAPAAEETSESDSFADVTAVTATGEPGAWTFAVTVSSPDTGCAKYADWWEVLSADGALKYRRILQHSHPDDQPFTRDGGPVSAAADEVLIVRAHMNPGGYGGAAMRGTAAGGFVAAPDVTASFAADVAGQEPLPTGCAF